MIVHIAKGPIDNTGRPSGFFVEIPEVSDDHPGDLLTEGTEVGGGRKFTVATRVDHRPVRDRIFYVTETNGSGAWSPTYLGTVL